MKKTLLATIALILVLIIGTESTVIAAAYSDDLSIENIEESNYTESSEEPAEIIDEIESERTEYSKTFLLENGNKMLVNYAIVHTQYIHQVYLNRSNKFEK